MEIEQRGAPPSKRTATFASLSQRSVLFAAIIIFALLTVGVLWPLLDKTMGPKLPISAMFLWQDFPMAPAVLVLPMLLRLPPSAAWPASSQKWPLGLALLLTLFCWWGHYGVLSAFDLSRDEKMANFDATILADGHLFAIVPLEWRRFLPALNNVYILPVAGNVAWVSDYLPGNAAFRALVGLVADRALSSPLLVGAGLLALHRIALRIWPDSPGSRATALICYAGSSQILIAGMSAYAMSAHLALDLIWLALFLRSDSRGTAGAIIIGFVATGLHQPLFHPLFALPFLLLEVRRNRRHFFFYLLGYGAISAFWLVWPHLVSHLANPTMNAGAQAPIGFLDRIRGVYSGLSANAVRFMVMNGLRFLTWQHPLLLPLAILGCGAARRSEPLVAALIASILLPLPVVAMLVPDPDFGWGYRYLHSVIGCACLLAGYGFQRLERAGGLPVRAMTIATVADLLFLLPVHCWMAHSMTAPALHLDDRLHHTPSDMVVIDTAPFSDDVTLNSPDLSNRPLRLLGRLLAPADMAVLCTRGSIAFANDAALSNFARDQHGVASGTSPHQKMLEAAAVRDGCRIRPFPPE